GSAVEDSAEVCGDHLVPFINAHAADSPISIYASVIHKNIQTAEALHRLFDQPVALVWMSDACLDNDRLLPLSCHLGQQLVRRFLVRVVVQDNLAAVVREFAGAGAAQTTGTAGDNRDFVGQAGHKSFPPLFSIGAPGRTNGYITEGGQPTNSGERRTEIENRKSRAAG